MREKESPVDGGASAKVVTLNIPLAEPAVKSEKQDNLVFFHTTFSALPAEEYKSAMSAIAQYAIDGTIPALSGAMQVIFTLAKDRIDGNPSHRRKRGGQAGNKNAVKKHEAVIESAAKNESETIKNESKTNQKESLSASVPVPVPVSATVPVEASTPLINLNLNNNLINLNLIAGNETKAETAKRIGSRLRGAGYFVTNKMLDKIISAIPDPAWLAIGYDYPTWVANYISKLYPGKPQPEKMKLFYSAVIPHEGKWEELRETYPNWLNEKMGNIITKSEEVKRKTPPTRYCPKCGESQPLQGLACPKCAGTYQWDEQAQKMEWYIHYGFPFSEEFGKIIESKRFKAQGVYLITTNAGTYADVKAYWENTRTAIADALLDAADAADRRYIADQPFRAVLCD